MANSTQGQVLVAPNWWLGLIPKSMFRAKKIPFGYEADFLPTTAGVAPLDVNTVIQADSDFLCLGISALVTTTANPPVLVWGSGFTNNAVSNFLIQIRDTGSGQNLFQAPVPLDNVAGSGPFPSPLSLPYVFQRASTIVTTLAGTSAGVVAANVRVTYWGVRVYGAVGA